MSEARGGYAGDEDRLPWLEPVEEEDEDGSGPSTMKLVLFVILGLVLLGVAVGGYFRFAGGDGGGGALIEAPEGPYKVRPPDPGGMEVEGEGDTAFAASEGEAPQGRLNMDAVPEAPVTQAPPAPKTAPKAEPEAAAAEPEAAQDAEPAAAAGATIQLGAFSSQASAREAWSALSGRFGYLAPLGHTILPVQTDGRTLYRLRASGPGAADICRRLKIAGEACVVVD